ncbi:2Fe-2S iron-sulfur cluster binding domain-containing protein [Thermomonas sp. RSS23]|uniref:2Fe-2S iron-sulfur cluster binding domain-containing protein n=1 Tax=Thermomonas beijingensis TaxID=2872701 RepID=A0ABS7TAR3_9GAMM|nr:2Fe-2S iron-sulfur cluster-binding protein [Thermomonas beijingensis]MBZ4184948.1 2Fe-2S iron-sulfur cluster binding domain-containing protein [Thermomonas beijingensis]
MPVITTTTNFRFDANTGITLLDAANTASLQLPYSCKTGRCGTCRCKVMTGSTHALLPELALTEQEKADGWILSCARTADTDLRIGVLDLGDLTLPPPRTLPCKINSLQRLAPDVVGIQLRLPPSSAFEFLPGQYIDVIGKHGLRRSYSIANPRLPNNTLELHVRAMQDGEMTRYWFADAKPEDVLRLHGPLGTFILRACSGMQLFFLATGTGIAPVKAMLVALTTLPSEQQPESVTVLWGGRRQEDLYFDVHALIPTARFIPVLSRADDAWQGARGHVQDVLLAMQPDFTNAAVYACGSDAMIHTAKAALLRAGLPADQFYSDAFVCSAAPTPSEAK